MRPAAARVHAWPVAHEASRQEACAVEVVSDETAFVRLQGEWNAAAARAGLAHPFLRHEWVRAYRLFLFKTGYDPAFAAAAPFKILTYLAIREAYAQGLAEVDFLGDAEPWKREWTPTSRGHDWVFVYSRTWRARLLHAVKFRWLPRLKGWRA